VTPARSLLLGVALLAALATVTGTAGFSATLADRSLQVSVADDDSAYLRFDQRARTVNATTNLTVVVRNQFPAGVTLASVDVGVGGERRPLGSLAAGETARVTFESVDCGAPISVAASGEAVSVDLDRTVACG
jgi:hypothetical protein